jgi:hypothetical protein
LLEPFREEHIEACVLRDDELVAIARVGAPHDPVLGPCDLILDHQRREDLMLFASAREALPEVRFARSGR